MKSVGGRPLSPFADKRKGQTFNNHDVDQSLALDNRAGEFAAAHQLNTRPPSRPKSREQLLGKEPQPFDTRIAKVNSVDYKNAEAQFRNSTADELSLNSRRALNLVAPAPRRTTSDAMRVSALGHLDMIRPDPYRPVGTLPDGPAATAALRSIQQHAGPKAVGAGHGVRGWDSYTIASAPLVPTAVVHAPHTPQAQGYLASHEAQKIGATGYPTGGLADSRPNSALHLSRASSRSTLTLSAGGVQGAGGEAGETKGRGLSAERKEELRNRGNRIDFRDGHVAHALTGQEAAAQSSERQRQLLVSRGVPVSQHVQVATPAAAPNATLAGPALGAKPESSSPIRRGDEYGNMSRAALEPSLRPQWVAHTARAESGRYMGRPAGDVPVDPRATGKYRVGRQAAVGAVNEAIQGAAGELEHVHYASSGARVSPVRVRVWAGNAAEQAKVAYNLQQAEAGAGSMGGGVAALETQRGRGSSGRLVGSLVRAPDAAVVAETVGQKDGVLVLDDPRFSTHVLASLQRGGEVSHADGGMAVLTGQPLPAPPTSTTSATSQQGAEGGVGSAALLSTGPAPPRPKAGLPSSYSARVASGAPSLGHLLAELVHNAQVPVGDTGAGAGHPADKLSLGSLQQGVYKAPFMQPLVVDRGAVKAGSGRTLQARQPGEDHDRYPEAAELAASAGGGFSPASTLTGRGATLTSTSHGLDPDQGRRVVDALVSQAHPFYAKARTHAHAVEVASRTAGILEATVLAGEQAPQHEADGQGVLASSMRGSGASPGGSTTTTRALGSAGSSRGAKGTVLVQASGAARAAADSRALRASVRSHGGSMPLDAGIAAASGTASALVSSLVTPAGRPYSRAPASSQLPPSLATALQGTLQGRPSSSHPASERAAGARTLRTSASQGQGISWALDLGPAGGTGGKGGRGQGGGPVSGPGVSSLEEAARAHAWAGYMAKSLAPTTPILKLGALHAGVEYSYPLRLRNQTPFVRRFRVSACGLSDAPSCPRGTLRVRFKSTPLAPGLSALLTVLVKGLEPGVLTGRVSLATDDGEVLHVVLGGYILAPPVFRQVRDAARAGQGLDALRAATDRLEVNAGQWDASYGGIPVPGAPRLIDGRTPLPYGDSHGAGLSLEQALRQDPHVRPDSRDVLEAGPQGEEELCTTARSAVLASDAHRQDMAATRSSTQRESARGAEGTARQALQAVARAGGPDFFAPGTNQDIAGLRQAGLGAGADLYLSYRQLGAGAATLQDVEAQVKEQHARMGRTSGSDSSSVFITSHQVRAVGQPLPPAAASPYGRGRTAAEDPMGVYSTLTRPGPGGSSPLHEDRIALGASSVRVRSTHAGGGSPMDGDWAALQQSIAEQQAEEALHAQAEQAATRGMSAGAEGRAAMHEEGEEEEGAGTGGGYPYEDLGLGLGGEMEQVMQPPSPTSALLKLSLAHNTTPGSLLEQAVARGLPAPPSSRGPTAAESALAAAFAHGGPDTLIDDRPIHPAKLEGVAAYPEHAPTVGASLLGLQKGHPTEVRAQAGRPRVGLGSTPLAAGAAVAGWDTRAPGAITTVHVNGGASSAGGTTVRVQGQDQPPTPGAQLAAELQPTLGTVGVMPEDLASTAAEDYIIPAGGTHPLLVPVI